MKPESQRIAIAEACGWSIHQIKVTGLKDIAILPPGVSIKDEGAVWKYCSIDLPDYLNSLDAMHEAEKVMNDEQMELYWLELNKLLDVWTRGRRTWVFESPASIRAQAFLRTLGLWRA
jgi:hypothetical protein